MQQEKRRQEKLQLQLAGDFVDHVIGSVFLGLDVYLAGLHTNLVGSAVIGLGTVNDIGHVVLFAAELHVQLRCKRGTVSYGYQQQGRGILCGIGINLAQPQSYFDAADLPHGTSLALQGAAIDLEQDPGWLAEALTDFGFDRPLYTFARDGFAPFREEYKAACVNIGRRVTFDLPDGGQGAGEAVDVDEEGRLVVRTDSGEEHVFTGEVSVRGIYGSL